VLVKDINTNTSYLAGDSFPYHLTNVNGTLFFTANDGTHGDELWRSDGTAAGTVLVRDINPGNASSSPSNLTNVNDMLFFTAVDGASGDQLWESNGTSAGTVLVKDINPGNSYQPPGSLTNINGTLFFSADDGTHGRQLWRSNGAGAGTVMLTDINAGFNYPFGTIPYDLTNVSGTLFFASNDVTHGTELWKSDGTAAGTVLVKDIIPGTNGSYPRYLTNVNGTLFFSAVDATHGSQLWQSNGSAAGTVMVSIINPNPLPIGVRPSFLTNVNGTLFFAANDGFHGVEPWVLSPTAPAVQVTSSPNPSTFAQAVTFTAAVAFSGSPIVPTGRVDFTEGTTDLTPGGVSLNGSGTATFSTSNLLGGTHTITATYSGDSNFAPSNGNDSASPQVVSRNADTGTLSANPTGSQKQGQAVTFLDALTSAVGVPHGGVVTFKDGTKVIGTSAVDIRGKAGLITSALLASGNPHTITAIFGGNANFAPSTSNSVVYTITAGSNAATTARPTTSTRASNSVGGALPLRPGVAASMGTSRSSPAFIDQSGAHSAGSSPAAAFNRLTPDAVTPTVREAKNDTASAAARRKTSAPRGGSLWELSVDDFFAALSTTAPAPS
jgi:ELWxxDGT repeat protein